jgi:hypothetical protein
MVSTRTSLALLAATLALTLGGQDASAASKKLRTQPQDVSATALTATPKTPHGSTAPDLVIVSILPAPDPIEGLPNQGYCYKHPAGGAANRIVFSVRNAGSAPAAVSTARVQFFDVGAVDAPIVALAPGQTRDVEVAIPDGCYPATYHGSCDYSIVADANSVIAEGSESNNVVLSLCLLPGG